MRSSIFVGICMVLLSANIWASTLLPEGVSEIPVEGLIEVSGVAIAGSTIVAVGDENADQYCTYPVDGKATEDCTGDLVALVGSKVYDAEAIDVSSGADGTQTWFALGEEAATVYISGDIAPIALSKIFKMRCGRGAEGLSVRRNEIGFDIVVLWEGGFACNNEWHSPQMVVCRLNDGEPEARCASPVPLQMETLLTGDEERFRAPDISWYGDEVVVLLGSAPPSGKNAGVKYAHTWLQVFGLDGSPIDARRIEMEKVWGLNFWRRSEAESKNWEALDISVDGSTAVLGYDRKGSSEIVVFDPRALLR